MACRAVCTTAKAVKQTNTQRMRVPVFPILKYMIWKNERPEAPGRSARGPEQRTMTMFKSQPIRPVPTTAWGGLSVPTLGKCGKAANQQ